MTSSSPSTGERFHTVVIGGGQAGLATGFHLAQCGVDFVILDAGARVGDAWRRRWDSLRLFTPAALDNLPGLPFPAPDKSHFPSKDEMADYVEQYASHFSLPVCLGVKVDRVGRDGDDFVVEAGSRRFEATNVVVATGPFQNPQTPAFAAELDPSIKQVHSAAYRNPAELGGRDGAALVVGAATSGAEIAMELARSRRTYLAGPSVKAIPRLVLRTIMPWLATRQRDTFVGKRLHAKVRAGGHPLIGMTYKKVLRSGVQRVSRVVGVRDGKPQLEDGRILEVASVVWCTGYGIDFSWIDLPVFGADGYPRHHLGCVQDQPGLYFVSLLFLHSLTSQLIVGVDRDTRHVTEELIRRSQSTRTSPIPKPGYQPGGSVA